MVASTMSVLAAILQRVTAPLKKADLLTVAHYLITRLSYNQIPAVILFGERAVRKATAEFMAHYHSAA